MPPPGQYEASKGDKPILGFSTKADKSSYHIESAIHHAKQTPTVCYKEVGSLTNLVKPRILETKIHPNKLTAQEVAKKPPKSKDPDMGTYNAPKCIDHFTDKTGFSGKLSSAPVPKFYDMAIKKSKGVPAPTHYKITQNHFNRLSRSPPSIRTRRH